MRRSLFPASDLQAEQVALAVPPQTQPVPGSGGQMEGEPVADPQQPPVQSLLIALQAELRAQIVHRAVGEGHPGSRRDHAHVHAHGQLRQPGHGGLQGPVVLAAIQHGFGVSQEITVTVLIWGLKWKFTK